MFFPLVLLLVSVLPQMASDAHRSDALALLTEVSQKYADAKSYHIEAVEERISAASCNIAGRKHCLRRFWHRATAIATEAARVTRQQSLSRTELLSGFTI